MELHVGHVGCSRSARRGLDVGKERKSAGHAPLRRKPKRKASRMARAMSRGQGKKEQA